MPILSFPFAILLSFSVKKKKENEMEMAEVGMLTRTPASKSPINRLSAWKALKQTAEKVKNRTRLSFIAAICVTIHHGIWARLNFD